MLKLYHQFMYQRRNIAGMLGMHEHFFRSARGERIMLYHGICKKEPTRFNTLFITEQIFEKHLQFYQKYFHVISLADFYNGNFRKDRFNICLSFDDGFANNYTYVLPLLEKYKIPATFFITAIRKEGSDILWNDFLTIASTGGPQKITINGEVYTKHHGKKYLSDNTNLSLAETLRHGGFKTKKEFINQLTPFVTFKNDKTLEDYWLQMTAEEIRELSESLYVTIGSHGYYHNDLARISATELASELNGSKEFLEKIIHKPVTALAFPYGSYSPAVVEAAVNAGYQQLLATDFMYPDNNKMLKERMGINPFISVHNQMFSIIKGNYE